MGALRDQDRVTVLIPKGVEVTLNVMGVSVPVTANPSGQFQGSHRNENLGSGNLNVLRQAIERIEVEAAQKRERSRRLKEAATNPEPALLYSSGIVNPVNRRRRPVRGEGSDVAATLEPIHVRGVDQRSGLALIIRGDGAKESMTWDLITRPLAGVEKKKLLTLAEKEQRAYKEIVEPTRVSDVLSSIKQQIEVEAVWDHDREVWVVKFGREELTVPPGYSARTVLESQIIARLIVKQTPYKFTDISRGDTLKPVGLVEYISDVEEGFGYLSLYDNLFKTTADITALDQAFKRARRAGAQREAYLKTLLIDRTQFTDGT